MISKSWYYRTVGIITSHLHYAHIDIFCFDICCFLLLFFIIVWKWHEARSCECGMHGFKICMLLRQQYQNISDFLPEGCYVLAFWTGLSYQNISERVKTHWSNVPTLDFFGVSKVRGIKDWKYTNISNNNIENAMLKSFFHMSIRSFSRGILVSIDEIEKLLYSYNMKFSLQFHIPLNLLKWNTFFFICYFLRFSRFPCAPSSRHKCNFFISLLFFFARAAAVGGAGGGFSFASLCQCRSAIANVCLIWTLWLLLPL